MVDAILTTKLFIPPARSELVSRPRLIDRLTEGLTRKLIVISAPAGSGNTTLLGEWKTPVARALNQAYCVPWRFYVDSLRVFSSTAHGDSEFEAAVTASRQAFSL